jgi:hypothetical protein
LGGTRFECGMLYETHTYRDVGESACKVEFVSNEILCTDMSNSGSVMAFRNTAGLKCFTLPRLTLQIMKLYFALVELQM